MAVRHLERIHHLFFVLLSLLAAAALYRFATILLGDLPWPSVIP
jgi:hypothetical protein